MLGVEGLLYCIRMWDGEVIWKWNFVLEYLVFELVFGVGVLFFVMDDMLVVMLGVIEDEVGFVVLNFDDGEICWIVSSYLVSYVILWFVEYGGYCYLICLINEGLILLDLVDGL